VPERLTLTLAQPHALAGHLTVPVAVAQQVTVAQ
jgi:hypothetical protein